MTDESTTDDEMTTDESTGNGALALVFDDGYVEDDEKVRPVLEERDVPASLAINPAALGSDGILSAERLHELVDGGWEVLGHGRRHRYLAPHPLAADASTGDERLRLESEQVFPDGDHAVYPGDSFEVTDGATTDEVVVAEKGTSDDGTPTVALESALEHSFAAAETVLQPTMDQLEDEIVGGKTALEERGFEPTGFALPYDTVGPRAWTLITDHFEAITYTVSPFPNPPGTSPLSLERYYLQTDYMRPVEIEAYLDAVVDSGGLGILAGHSAWDVVTQDRLAAVVDAALERDIEVTTLAGGLEAI